jgi:hypothetical protein
MDYCGVGSVIDLVRVIKRTLNEDEISVLMAPVLKVSLT